MKRRRSALWWCVGLTVLSVPVFSPADDAPVVRETVRASEIDALVKQLADFDPTVRRDASTRLSALGVSARPALRAASMSDDLQLQSQASKLLLQLPWTSEDDPQPVQVILSRYGDLDVEQRKQAAYQLINLEREQGDGAVLRLLRDEVSPAVRWETLRSLQQATQKSTDRSILRQLRALTPDDKTLSQTDSVLAAASGWAWLRQSGAGQPKPVTGQADTRPAPAHRAEAALRRAVELERAAPTDAGDAMDFAYDHLYALSIKAGDLPSGAELLRDRIRTAGGEPAPRVMLAVGRLLTLHAQEADLPGLDVSMSLIQPFMSMPEVMYGLGRLKLQQTDDAAGRALLEKAFNASAGNLEARVQMGEYLYDLRWHDQAERELLEILKTPGPNENLHRSNALFRLANIAGGRGQDDVVADRLQAALDLMDNSFALTGGSVEGIRASIVWHRLRDAKKRDDKDAVERTLNDLAATTPDSVDVLLEAVPMLEERNRRDDAKALFQRGYDTIKQKVDEPNPTPESMNSLAWLAARSSMKLDEALLYATRATEADPLNPAFIDTLAEVKFRLGRFDEAVALEERALTIRPDDTFMQEQLEKFKKAAAEKAR